MAPSKKAPPPRKIMIKCPDGNPSSLKVMAGGTDLIKLLPIRRMVLVAEPGDQMVVNLELAVDDFDASVLPADVTIVTRSAAQVRYENFGADVPETEIEKSEDET